MKNMHDDDLSLSPDPGENLRMENQLLELRLKAEFGAEAFLEGDIPADIEHEFLMNVLESENSFQQSKETKICDLLGNPGLAPETELDDLQVEQFLNEVTEMLIAKDIAVNFEGDYDNRTRYKFITEELFEERVLHSGIPGMTMHFIYEEFHPDHKIDLERKTKNFISAWFEREPDKLLWELSDQIILPEGGRRNKDEVKETLQNLFNRYSRFFECKYFITGLNFEVNDDTGMACTEGMVSYNAEMSDREAIAIQGAFKLYFCQEYGWWDVCYFVFPGIEFKGDRDTN